MTTIKYTLVRSGRRTIELTVENDARLVVRAPYRVSDKEIADFIRKKEHWILEKQLQVSAIEEKYSAVTAADGQTIMYLGNTYAICVIDCDSISIEGTVMYLPQDCSTDDIAQWLKEEALRVISERTDYYADLMGVTYSVLKLSNAKRRWGSCGVNDSLNYAWRLIMCPMPVIDYIVVHELSHITYKNHGKWFWASVKMVLPNYKKQQDWLKANRKLMEII
ncbi:MAG: SprT family zinc-dependent metalloprotease [Bacillota bacterium]|jgi:hypothetical protein